MRILMTLLILFCLTSLAEANTFVGNGGNAGDVELQVTLLQIRRSLTDVVENKYIVKELCTCDESMEGHKICEALKALSVEQKNYCEKTLVTHTNEFLTFINGKAGVQITWTKEAMEVDEVFGSREALAVTQPQAKTILLNREDYLNLKDYERIFLLTHELGHLVKIESRFLRDDEMIGPFKQKDGGRQLLNSIGAAVAMKSLTNDGIDDYKGSLRRSKNFKKHWLQASLGSEAEHKDQTNFAIKNYAGYDYSYRYQINQPIGVSVGARYVKGSGTFYGSIKTENEMQFWNAQLHYRLFPFSNPLTFWGQSHVVLGLGYEAGTAEIKLADSFVSSQEKVNLAGALLSAQYYLPLYVGIWLQGGLSLTMHPYEYKTVNFKSESNQIYLNLGAGYAF
ncbi:MAG: hypothetical protein H7061_14135 [Bdellovibrionaceae bacterium]|nr:hypothetical protein [Bdellovibrio sp.]